MIPRPTVQPKQCLLSTKDELNHGTGLVPDKVDFPGQVSKRVETEKYNGNDRSNTSIPELLK